MGSTRLNSRIFTNSFAGQNGAAYYPYYVKQQGNSFYGLSREQYYTQTYYQLANNGAGGASSGRAARWTRAYAR